MDISNEIQKLDQVQFDFVNISSSAISVSIFDSQNGEVVQVPTTRIPNTSPTTSISNVFNASINTASSVYCPSNNSIYVFDYDSSSLNPQQFNATTFALVNTLSFTTNDVQGGVIYCPYNNSIYVAMRYNTTLLNSRIIRISCDTNTIVSTIYCPFSANAEFWSLTYDPNTNMVYAPYSQRLSSGLNGFFSINCINDSYTSVPTYNGSNLYSSYDSLNNRLWITSTTNKNYIIYDFDTSSIIYTAPINSFLGALSDILFNSYNNCFYIGCTLTQSVYVVDCNTYQILYTINAGANIGRMVFDLPNDKLYVNSTDRTFSVINTLTNTFAYSNTYSSSIANQLIWGNIIVTSAFNVFSGTYEIDFMNFVDESFYLNTYYVTGTGAVSYNYFMQSISSNPILVNQIQMDVEQSSSVYPLQVQYTDVNGIQKNNFYFPNTTIDTFQAQSNQVQIDFEEPILFDLNQKIVGYIIPANQTVTFVFSYKQYLKSDLLDDVVIYDDSSKAKYKIEELELGKIKATKYWGAKDMPEKLSLSADWFSEMKKRFYKVELIEKTPKLRSGDENSRHVFGSLLQVSNKRKQIKPKVENVKKPIKLKNLAYDVFDSLKDSLNNQSFEPEIFVNTSKKDESDDYKKAFYKLVKTKNGYEAFKYEGHNDMPEHLVLSNDWKKDMDKLFFSVNEIK